MRLSRHASVIIVISCSKHCRRRSSRVASGGQSFNTPVRPASSYRLEILQPRLCLIISNKTGAQATITPPVLDAASARQPSLCRDAEEFLSSLAASVEEARWSVKIATHCMIIISYAKGNHLPLAPLPFPKDTRRSKNVGNFKLMSFSGIKADIVSSNSMRAISGPLWISSGEAFARAEVRPSGIVQSILHRLRVFLWNVRPRVPPSPAVVFASPPL